MRYWTYSINSHPDWMKGSIHLEELPVWVDLLEKLCTSNIIYKSLSWIKLPGWPKFRFEDCEEKFSLSEWYGTLGDIYWLSMQPIWQWAYKHRKKIVELELGYDKVKELFYTHDPEFFDKMEELHEEDSHNS